MWQNRMVVAVVASVAGALVALGIPWLVNEINRPPADSIVQQLMDQEVHVAEAHSGDQAVKLYAPDAVVVDAGCQNPGTGTIWRGERSIWQRYEALPRFASLSHVNAHISWIPSNDSATRASATADTLGATSPGTPIRGREYWEFARVDGKWLITSFTYNLCFPSASSALGPSQRLIRGLAFAPFRVCQSPTLGVFPSIAQMRQDVDIIATETNALRTYSVLNEGSEAAAYAVSKGLQVSPGAWLGPEKTDKQRATNQAEIAALISLANRVRVKSVIVGNEVLLRGDLSPQRLASYIEEVKAHVHVPVTTAETADVLMKPENRVVVDAADYLMVHIYPYWQGISINGAAWYVADEYAKVRKALGKQVVIGETGWPSAGPALGAAVPSVANARRFLAEWMAVAVARQIPYYYFSSFDEMYKIEGGIGSHWGLMTAMRQPKFGMPSLLADPATAPRHPVAYQTSAPARPAPATFPVYTDWLENTAYIPSDTGDTRDITFNDCWLQDPNSGITSIKVHYTGTGSRGWAGVYWLAPKGNWGTDPKGGHDMRGFRELTFYARGDYDGEVIAFFSGGITGRYGDTASKHGITVALTTSWQKYTIDLTGADLHRVVGAFGWAASASCNHGTFYLDDIQFEKKSSAPAPAPPATFPVYTDWFQNTDYIPSGYMGDTKGITLDDCSQEDPHSGTTSIMVKYDHYITPGSKGWAGVYWQSPQNNWGTDPRGGHDLQGFRKLTFYARGYYGNERITFFSGGITGPYGDTASKHAITVDLTLSWRKYTINLTGADLHRVVGAFGWAASGTDNYAGATFYLDDIQFEK